jgi:hypothetical protein
MDSKDKKPDKEDPQEAADLEERRGVIKGYIADLRAFLNKVRRKLN